MLTLAKQVTVTPGRMAVGYKKRSTSVGNNMSKLELSSVAFERPNDAALVENKWQLLQELNIELAYDPAIPMHRYVHVCM